MPSSFSSIVQQSTNKIQKRHLYVENHQVVTTYLFLFYPNYLEILTNTSANPKSLIHHPCYFKTTIPPKPYLFKTPTPFIFDKLNPLSSLKKLRREENTPRRAVAITRGSKENLRRPFGFSSLTTSATEISRFTRSIFLPHYSFPSSTERATEAASTSFQVSRNSLRASTCNPA